MKHLSRSTALKLAAVITVVLNLTYIFVFDLADLLRGADTVNAMAAAGGGPPYAVVLLFFVVEIVGLVAAYGVWRGQKWGIILVIFTSALRVVNGLMGFLFAPLPPPARLMIGGSIALGLLVIVLCLWRGEKPALA